MEHIRQALKRVRSNPSPVNPSPVGPQGLGAGRQSPEGPLQSSASEANIEQCTPLDAAHLEKNRIITHTLSDGRSRNFHILRTQLVREMDTKGWQFLAVT